MQLKNYNVYFFFLVLVVISAVTFLIFQPFLTAIMLAAVLAIIFRGPFNFFLRRFRNRVGLSALFTSILAVLVFIIPIFLALGLVTNEILNIYHNNFESGKISVLTNDIISNVNDSSLAQSLGITELITKESLTTYLQNIGQSSISVLQGAYQGVVNFILISFVVFFTLYYLLINGQKVTEKIMKLSPLKNEHEQLLVDKFISISRATIKGTLVVAFVQGFIGGLTFAIAGIPSSILWGVIMMIFSVVPIIGASIIWFPASIILLLTGSIWEGFFVLIVGLFIISLIDNFLRPELVGKDTQMHPLMVFFATLGGVGVFGFLGFILGPVVVALFLSLWDIYAVEFKRQLSRFNNEKI